MESQGDCSGTTTKWIETIYKQVWSNLTLVIGHHLYISNSIKYASFLCLSIVHTNSLIAKRFRKRYWRMTTLWRTPLLSCPRSPGSFCDGSPTHHSGHRSFAASANVLHSANWYRTSMHLNRCEVINMILERNNVFASKIHLCCAILAGILSYTSTSIFVPLARLLFHCFSSVHVPLH